MTVGFRVFGNPAPQGSKIPGASKSGKLFVREQAGQKLTDWRQNIEAAALLARGDSPAITVACSLQVDFFLPKPASVNLAKRPYPAVQPDLDKMVRAVGDALQSSELIKNDSLIIKIIATKRYAGDTADTAPGAWIVVVPIPTLQ